MDIHEIFVCVVEQGSFNKAADVLGLSQPTVSKQIDRLEDSLGVSLFKRSTRQLLLTNAGKLFFERAKNISELIEDSRNEIRQISKLDDDMLRIYTTPSIARYLLPTVLKALTVSNPKAKFKLYIESEAGNYYQSQYDLKYDLFIREGEPGDCLLVSRTIAEVPLGFYASPVYLQENGFLENSNDSLTRGHFLTTRLPKDDVWISALVPSIDTEKMNIRITSNDTTCLVPIAVASVGIIVVPDYMVRTELQSGALQAIDLGISLRAIPITALYRKSYQSTLASECLALLSDYMADLYPR